VILMKEPENCEREGTQNGVCELESVS